MAEQGFKPILPNSQGRRHPCIPGFSRSGPGNPGVLSSFQGLFEVRTIFLLTLRHYLPFSLSRSRRVPWNFKRLHTGSSIQPEMKEMCKNIKQ